LLDYLCAPELDRGADAFVSRHREVAGIRDLFGAPAEPSILAKLVWPLRHAKGSYALGNYLGCIALCGMVGEMASILLWEIAKVRIQGKPVDESSQKALFGSSVEKLGQDRRIQVLGAFGLIDADTRAAFDRLRDIRRKYLHLFSHSHDQIPTDARQAYQDALLAVSVVLGQTFSEGSVAFRQDLMAYLAERGLLQLEEGSRDA
jgi:hypothetical protein